jgi:hypothetical protein
MNATQAWILPVGEDKNPGPGRLELSKITLDDLRPDEVLVEPLLVGWEGNSHHAVERRPIDVCRVRGEQQVQQRGRARPPAGRGRVGVARG